MQGPVDASASDGGLTVDAGPKGNDAGTTNPPTPGPKLVFVSSASFTGKMGGAAGADARCTTLANAAGHAGTYKAWIRPDIAARNVTSFGPFVRVDGAPVGDLKQIAGSQLGNSISLDETGSPLAVDVWTGGGFSIGSPPSGPIRTCNDWTLDDANAKGGIGRSDTKYQGWEFKTDVPCSSQAHLYCFQE